MAYAHCSFVAISVKHIVQLQTFQEINQYISNEKSPLELNSFKQFSADHLSTQSFSLMAILKFTSMSNANILVGR